MKGKHYSKSQGRPFSSIQGHLKPSNGILNLKDREHRNAFFSQVVRFQTDSGGNGGITAVLCGGQAAFLCTKHIASAGVDL